MIGVALKGLLGRKLRAILTAFAIVLGVAMISGSFVLTDTLGKSFDGIYDESYRRHRRRHQLQERHRAPTTAARRRRPFSANVLDQGARQLPGVRVAQGSIEDETSLIDADGKPIGGDRHRARRRTPDADQSLNPLQLVTGDWPRGDGRSRSTSRPPRPSSCTVGQTVGAYGDGPVQQVRDQRHRPLRLGRLARRRHDLGLRPARPPSACSTSTGKLDLIRVGAKPGVSDDGARAPDPPAPLRDHEGETRRPPRRPRTATRPQEGMSIIKYLLLGFGGIALFVGSFVIANTLAITVAQRMRELATLRTLGASRRQVLGSVVLESLVIGLVGSVVGLFLGLGIAAGLKALVTATGIELPSGGLVFAPRTIIVSLAVGTLIALLASLRPAHQGHARRADRGRPRGRRAAGVAVRPLRTAGGAGRHRGCRRAVLLRRVRERPRRRWSGSSRSSAGCCCCSSAWRWSPRASSARWPTCSALPGASSAARPAGSPARTPSATRRAPPRPPPR